MRSQNLASGTRERATWSGRRETERGYALPGDLAHESLAGRAGLARVAEGIHDDIRVSLNGLLVGDVRVLVEDEKDVHQVAARAQLVCRSDRTSFSLRFRCARTDVPLLANG